jgi:hypothetical protein
MVPKWKRPRERNLRASVMALIFRARPFGYLLEEILQLNFIANPEAAYLIRIL